MTEFDWRQEAKTFLIYGVMALVATGAFTLVMDADIRYGYEKVITSIEPGEHEHYTAYNKIDVKCDGEILAQHDFSLTGDYRLELYNSEMHSYLDNESPRTVHCEIVKDYPYPYLSILGHKVIG